MARWEADVLLIRIDLHVHSTFSDGTLSPEELAALAKQRRIVVASLADHDTVNGVARFLGACRKFGIKAVSGVELSADYPSVLHILGYRFDVEGFENNSVMEKIKNGRHVRNIEICEKLRALGVEISFDEVLAVAGNVGVVGRPHFARVLVSKGHSADIKGAFAKYLVRGAPGYAERFRVPPEDCIALIREAGGLAVLAHPAQTAGRHCELSELEPLLVQLKSFGLWGLECYSTKHSAAQIFESLKLANKVGLYATAGSDFHGANRPGCEIGVRVPDDCVPWARFCGGL